MNFKSKLHSYLNSGHTFGIEESNIAYRVGFINSGIALGGLTAFMFAIIRFYAESYLMGFVDLAFALSIFYIVYAIKKDKKNIDFLSKIMVAIIYIFFMLVIYYVQNSVNLMLIPIFLIITFFFSSLRVMTFWYILTFSTLYVMFGLVYDGELLYYKWEDFLGVFSLSLIMLGGLYIYDLQRYENIEELTYIRENLENLVKERTRELQRNFDELKSTQEQLIESEKMASLGTLVAGVAHEINTPVGVALTGITHLEDELKHIKKVYEDETISEEDFYSFLEHSNEINQSIQINIRRAAELVKSFKQVAVDQSSQEDREINIKAYVEDILLSLGSKFKQTKHKVNLNIDENLNIKTNPGTLSQILTNLIMNSLVHAFKSNENGIIDIEIKDIKGKVSIVYKDNGVGLNEDIKKHIFDPFFTTNRENGGSGLGMNIVYNLVTQNLKGTIKLDSSLGSGVRFKMEFKV